MMFIVSVFASTLSYSATIMVHGDSLSAGYGLQPGESWVSILGEVYKNQHTIVNTSISGENTKGGLERLPSLINTHQPDILIIELGANDGLRGYPIIQMKENLQEMIHVANHNQVKVILVGIRLPPNLGKRYTEPFFNSFAELATLNEVLYVPFLLEGVAGNAILMQEDGLHPTSDAQETIMLHVQPTIEQALLRLK